MHCVRPGKNCRLSRISLKFGVRVIMPVDIHVAYHHARDKILLLVEFIYFAEEKHLIRQTIQFERIPVEFVVPFIRYVCSKSCKN